MQEGQELAVAAAVLMQNREARRSFFREKTSDFRQRPVPVSCDQKNKTVK